MLTPRCKVSAYVVPFKNYLVGFLFTLLESYEPCSRFWKVPLGHSLGPPYHVHDPGLHGGIHLQVRTLLHLVRHPGAAATSEEF
jgi:hypothetical protein